MVTLALKRPTELWQAGQAWKGPSVPMAMQMFESSKVAPKPPTGSHSGSEAVHHHQHSQLSAWPHLGWRGHSTKAPELQLSAHLVRGQAGATGWKSMTIGTTGSAQGGA